MQVSFMVSAERARQLISVTGVVEALWVFPIGLLVREKGYFKPIILAAVPLYCLGEVLMMVAPAFDHSVSRLLFSQILLAIARSSFEAVKEVALLSASEPIDTAVVLAILSVCDKVGGMIGSTFSDIVWAEALPDAPRKYLSAEAISSAERLHPELQRQLSFPPGSAERIAIQHTYDETQRTMLIIGSVAMVFALGCALVMRNDNILRVKLPGSSVVP